MRLFFILNTFENLFLEKMRNVATNDDPAHDILHIQRVVKTAKILCEQEKACIEVVVPAAWLHDFVNVSKNDPRRKMASQISAEAAIQYLKSLNYPEIYLSPIGHAIEAHSFSAQIEPRTLEASIVQDADRLDALGAIGIARCFATAGLMKRTFYSANDPFCDEREPDDSKYTIDHFFKKLFVISSTLKTKSAQLEGNRRLFFMKSYLQQLKFECEIDRSF